MSAPVTIVGAQCLFGVERVLRNRFVRIAVAAVLISVAGWGFLPYAAYRVAPSAFVNADLVRVTAPIAGRVVPSMPRKGQFVDRSVSLPLIESLSPDRRHLLDLERQSVLAKNNTDIARQQLHEIEAFDFELGTRAEVYRRGITDKLEKEVAEAEAEEAGCLAEFRQRREVGSRLEALTRSGIISEVRTAEALAIQEAASTRCRVVAAKRSRIRIELEAARSGTFLRDGANDVPYSQQQRDRLKLRRQELETVLSQETARVNQLDMEIAAERDHIEQTSSYRVTVPAEHVVWATAASPGSAVTEGQTLFDLADCSHRFVVVELPERDFEQIKAGDAAFIRLIGGGEWRQGHVQQVRGSAARSDDRLFAAQVPNAAFGSIAVEVALPTRVSSLDRVNFCDIGRLAEVRFNRQMFGFLSTLTDLPLRAAQRTPSIRRGAS